MNCFDCALVGAVTSAVAFCHDCGAGVCLDHAVARQRHLTRTVPLIRLIEVEPPARLIRCATCTAAHDAVNWAAAPKRRHAEPHVGIAG
jgi:hypothetical protein